MAKDKPVVKNPIAKKTIAVFLIGGASWLIGSSIRPVLENYIGTNPIIMISVAFTMIFIGYKLLGSYIKY